MHRFSISKYGKGNEALDYFEVTCYLDYIVSKILLILMNAMI